ncbi:MAG: response regulator transcription factor [Terriglobales bacterium]
MNDRSSLQTERCRLTPVFLLTENRLLREALIRILSKRVDVTVVGAVAFGPAVLDQILTSAAEVLLLDSPGLAFHGPRLVASIRRMLPAAKVVMIGMERDETTFLRAVRNGVMGYMLKDASALDIVNVVRAVGSGETVCPPCFSRALFQCAAEQLAAAPEVVAFHPLELSRREQQLVGLVAFGLTNKEIASRLRLSERTVKNHFYRIFRKAGVHDRMAMIERCRIGEVTSS